MATKQWTAPVIHTTYGQLRQTLNQHTNRPGSIDPSQADVVHRRWRTLGKLTAAGRLK